MFAGFRDERSSTELQLPRTLCKIALMKNCMHCAQEGVMRAKHKWESDGFPRFACLACSPSPDEMFHP